MYVRTLQSRIGNSSSNMSQWGSNPSRTIAHTRLDDESKFSHIYEAGQDLGRGSFGNVIKATHKTTGEVYAIKIVVKEKAGSTNMMLLQREVEILKIVHHEHIIDLLEILESSKKMYIVMELCDGVLSDLKLPITEDDARLVMTRLASAISYLHKKDIVHRDLKLENILKATNPNDPNDNLYIKVTDFGLSVVKGGVGYENLLDEWCGTLLYMAPEILNNKTYSHQCDVWAMGVIAYYLLCGSPPFQSKDEATLRDLILKGVVQYQENCWQHISKEAKDCVKRMLECDTSYRITAGEIPDHPWIKGTALGSGAVPNVLVMMKEFNVRNQTEHDEESSDDGSVRSSSSRSKSLESKEARQSQTSPSKSTSQRQISPRGHHSSSRPSSDHHSQRGRHLPSTKPVSASSKSSPPVSAKRASSKSKKKP